jgi:hypothetical protein
MHLRGTIILIACLLSVGGIGYLIHLVRRIRSDHEKVAGGIPIGDIGVLKDKIDETGEGIRRHISSNHDEIDGEVRRIATNTEATQRALEFDRSNQFAEQLARELDAARAVKETLKKDDGQ